MDISNICKLEIKDAIVHAKYEDDVLIDLAAAKAIVEARKKIANHLPHKVLVTGGPIVMTPEARKFALSDDANSLISAWAIVTKDNLLKLTFYKLLFFTQNRRHKMRFFSDMNTGLNWLMSTELEAPSLLSKKEALL